MRSRRAGIVAGALLMVGVATGSAIHRVRAQRPWSPPAVANDSVRPTGATVVAVVDGSPIVSDDLDLRLEQLLPIAAYHRLVDPDRLLSVRRAALDDLALDELIYREAIAAGKRAPDVAVDAELAKVKARFDDTGQFIAALRENGLTEDRFRERLARKVLVREARADHERQVVTEADIASYYRANSARFQHPERVHLLEILFRADPAEPSSSVVAQRKARAVLDRLRGGEDFGAIARASSEDEYRVKDGDMGLVHRGRLDAEFEDAVFSAPVGRFEIARSLYGFEVFKVLERQGPTQLSLDQARPIIAAGLERQRREEGLRAWHARLLAGARIEILDTALRNARAAELPSPGMGPNGHRQP